MFRGLGARVQGFRLRAFFDFGLHGCGLESLGSVGIIAWVSGFRLQWAHVP